MESVDLLKIVVAINASTLIAILTYGYRVVRFFNRIEFKTDLMWSDYEARMLIIKEGRHYIHKRSTDIDEIDDSESSD